MELFKPHYLKFLSYYGNDLDSKIHIFMDWFSY